MTCVGKFSGQYKVDETGGYVTLASVGLEINYRNITVGTNLQLPFAEEFAHGQTEAKTRGCTSYLCILGNSIIKR